MKPSEYADAKVEPIFLHPYPCPHGCYPSPHMTNNGPGIFKRALNSFFSFVKKVSSTIGKFLVKERATASAVVFGCLMWNMYNRLDSTMYNLKRLWNYTNDRKLMYDDLMPRWRSTNTCYDTM